MSPALADSSRPGRDRDVEQLATNERRYCGMVTVNVLPTPTVLVTSTVPS
jgi:hypothetical protein